MLHVRLLAAMAAMIGLCEAALPPVPHRNLIKNGGFEQGEGLPAVWARHPAVNNGRNCHARDMTLSQSGKASGKLVYLEPVAGPNKAAVQWMKYGIPVEGGSILTLSGWVRTKGVRFGRAGMHIYDGTGKHLGFRAVAHPPGTDTGWRRFKQAILLPPEAATVGVALYAKLGGTTWYDDISLTSTPNRWAEPKGRLQDVDALFRNAEGKPFAVRAASSLQKISRNGKTLKTLLTREVKLQAARDEAESFQLVLIPGRASEPVKVAPGELRGPGPPIPFTWYRVGYVETGKPRGYRASYTGWWPDILLPPAPIVMRKGELAPLWFTVTVPPDAVPGKYLGQITLTSGAHTTEVPVTLQVRTFRLPRPGSLPCAFGLYAHVLSRYYHGSKSYKEAMRTEAYGRWIEAMGRYRLTPKNLANEYHGVRTEKGRKLPDLSRLKPLFAASAALAFPPYSFCVFRLPCPRDWQTGKPKSDPQATLNRLTAQASEYRRLGLPAQAYIYGIDEPSPEGYPFVRSIYQKVRKAAPGFPIMQTVNHRIPEELAGVVDIWCPLSARLSDGAPFYKQRLEAGDTLWLYVCCSPKPPYANFFIDQPAVDHRVLFWQARQAGATGVLYWCVCWWEGLPGPHNGQPAFPNTPVRATEHLATYSRYGVNGDGLLFWPGPDMTPYPSLRVEIIRDGIEDYEYLALLSRCVSAAEALPEERRPKAALLAAARALCTVPPSVSQGAALFSKDPDVILNRRRAVADAIEALAAVLGTEFP